ncbi:MAG TPA: triphosphoribosyl-dephospho-CoA synthase [Thermoleophilia bacterium]|nr:triphosphoribosyl-dephospho-CoA synthase [Thermoleophilia bacterium]
MRPARDPAGAAMEPLRGPEIARAARLACLIEASVPKPGNVSPQARFADTTYADLVASAGAIAPALAEAGQRGVGETVLRAVRDTRRVAASNTNLGIVLLLAPLAKAAAGGAAGGAASGAATGAASGAATAGLRPAVAAVLAALTVDDARLAYEAVRMASPGGMGRVDRADVNDLAPAVTLREAMELAAARDSIAREYVTDFEVTFTIGVPALRRAWTAGEGRPAGTRAVADAGGPAIGPEVTDAVLRCFLEILARVPDTLIARKRDFDVARRVSMRAAQLLAALGGDESAARRELTVFDRGLRDPAHALNPGATADLVTAALFVVIVEDGMVDAAAAQAAPLLVADDGVAPGTWGEGMCGTRGRPRGICGRPRGTGGRRYRR